MAYAREYYRDKIVLNPSFAARLKLETVAKGTTLLLAAREIKVEQEFTLDDYNLVLLADRFDNSSGSIQVRTTAAVAENAPGIAGPTVTIVCRQLAGINVTSTGGKGGVGVRGAQGKPGRRGATSTRIDKPGKPGGPGGTGETGGRGAVGGSGGQLILTYIADQVPGGFNPHASLQSVGGPGGEGGPGGPGGVGGPGGSGTPEGEQGPLALTVIRVQLDLQAVVLL